MLTRLGFKRGAAGIPGVPNAHFWINTEDTIKRATSEWGLQTSPVLFSQVSGMRALRPNWARTKLAVTLNGAPGFYVWNLSTGSRSSAGNPLTSAGQGVAWKPDDTRLAVGGSDGGMSAYDTSLTRKMALTSGVVPYAADMQFTPDGNLLVIATYGDSLVILNSSATSGDWSAVSGYPATGLTQTRCCAVISNSYAVIGGSASPYIKLLNLGTKAFVSNPATLPTEAIIRIFVTAGNMVIAQGLNNLYLYSFNGSALVHKQTVAETYVLASGLSYDEDYFFCAVDGIIHYYAISPTALTLSADPIAESELHPSGTTPLQGSDTCFFGQA